MKSTILYEPLPIARIGVLRDEQSVVFANDFSTFAFMLEEFVALAVTEIAIPKSAPEAAVIESMPTILRRRVRILEDRSELEAVNRILMPVYEELGVECDSSEAALTFPKNTYHEHRRLLMQTHSDLFRLAVGFNHNVQVNVVPKRTLKVLRALRMILRRRTGRAVIAQVEGLIRAYQPLQVDSLAVPANVPAELISIFDQLVNDPDYTTMSGDVARLAMPKTRRAALARLREKIRRIIASSKFGSIWNTATRMLSVWSGAPLPEADQLAGVVVPRSFPVLVDTAGAREAAVRTWFGSTALLTPCDRAGIPFRAENVHWLPPLKATERSCVASNIAVGSGVTWNLDRDGVSELVDALNQAMAMLRTEA